MVFSLSVMHSMAESRSERILDEMSDAIDDLGGYRVRFEVTSGGAVVDGEYVVDGELYRLTIANQIIYGDGSSRFTIDETLKEVIQESIDSSIPMVIANPARAFQGLSKIFDSKVIMADGGDDIVILLTPRKDNDLLDSSQLVIDPTTKLPLSAKYSADGEVIEVNILDIERISTNLVALSDILLPDGYEIIDIR